MTYISKIKAAKKRRKLSNIRIAKAIGISSQAVNQWFNGVCMPNDDNHDKLMDVLHDDFDKPCPACGHITGEV